MKMSDAAVAERGKDLLADGAGAENQRAAVREFAEDALGELDAGGGDRHRASAQLGLGADPFAGFERALEEAVENGAGGAVLVGETIGFADLAEDFGFAEEKRVEPGGDAEKMADGGAIVVMVKDAIENVRANGMEFAEEGRQAGSAFVGSFGWDAVNLAAVAGGEDERFFEQAAGAEFVRGAASLFGGEGDALAELE
jgi:hypothetical protein